MTFEAYQTYSDYGKMAEQMQYHRLRGVPEDSKGKQIEYGTADGT